MFVLEVKKLKFIEKNKQNQIFIDIWMYLRPPTSDSFVLIRCYMKANVRYRNVIMMAQMAKRTEATL